MRKDGYHDGPDPERVLEIRTWPHDMEGWAWEVMWVTYDLDGEELESGPAQTGWAKNERLAKEHAEDARTRISRSEVKP